jgi:hypothetical protein
LQASVEFRLLEGGGQGMDSVEVGALHETIGCFGDRAIVWSGRTLDPLVPVENNLGAQRRVTGHADGQVPPLRIDAVDIIMFDVWPLFCIIITFSSSSFVKFELDAFNQISIVPSMQVWDIYSQFSAMQNAAHLSVAFSTTN